MKVSKAIVLTAMTLCLLLSGGCPAGAQTVQVGIKKVVIDAGHGGTDPGCVYQQYREKDIVLAVALRLGALINENYPDVQVIYTRKTDVLIPLGERGNIANKAAADLFISIHVNAARNTGAKGTETFVMGVDKSGANLELAMKENDVITYEKDYTTAYEGYKPGDAESFIIFSLMQYSYQGQSLNFANMAQNQYIRHMGMGDRGVKQAGLLVLWRTTMPSVLTELGFLSNADDRKLLVSKSGQEKLARCLFNSFSEYKTKAEGSGKLVVLGNANLPADEDTPGGTESTPTGTAATAGNAGSAASTETTGGKIIYRIQVLTSSTKVPKNSPRFGIYRGKVTEMLIDGRYKYFTGSAASYEEALSLQRKVRETIKDAFTVVFRDGKQITMDEARRTK